MATAKAERLLNLVIALVNSPRYRTAAWIREKVAGYGDSPTDEAFFRTFERDKAELRDLGIPVATDGQDGYLIPPGEFALPQLEFTPAEKAALGLAGRLWETTALGAAGSGGLRKIRDAEGGPAGPGEDSRSAVGLLQPRVRTGDPAFAPLYAAVRDRRPVTFDYRPAGSGSGRTRSVQPWGLVSLRGRWYLVGHDADRGALRTFRLSRITGAIRPVGRTGSYQVPPEIDLLELVAATVERPAERTGRLLLRSGAAAGLRRHSVPAGAPAPPEWERVDIPVGHLWDTAREIAANGADVVVEEPVDLQAAVIRLLTGAAGDPAADASAPSDPDPAPGLELPGMSGPDGSAGGPGPAGPAGSAGSVGPACRPALSTPGARRTSVQESPDG